MRKQIAAANWKMNLTLDKANSLTDELLTTDHQVPENGMVILAVPFPYLLTIKEKFAGKDQVFVAAQNCSDKQNGAFTGEVSAEMLQSMGLKYVILGHSERREYYHDCLL